MARVIIYAMNTIGELMNGASIRAWEIAKALAKHHQVILVAPNETTMTSTDFVVTSRAKADQENIYAKNDCIISQSLPFFLAYKAKRFGLKIIIDAYDPLPLERLEQFKHDKIALRNLWQNASVTQLNFNFKMADGIICASEKQRDLWIGYLMSLNLLSVEKYDADSSLRLFIDVVSFGLSHKAPQRNAPGIREKYHFKVTDKVILWGGGIWNWFDPLTLIQAMKILEASHPHFKLVFMGIKNPEPSVPEMEMCGKAIQLAKTLNLFDRTVFFNAGWIPYHERQNILLDADIGISTHFDHLETRFSFRTRILDYIWAKLPILSTQGDSFADLIEQNELGICVPYENAPALANAIIRLIEDGFFEQRIKENLQQMQNAFHWNNVVKPIEKMLSRFAHTPKKKISSKEFLAISKFFVQKVIEKIYFKIKKIF